jgi:hypothetical protein
MLLARYRSGNRKATRFQRATSHVDQRPNVVPTLRGP